MSEPLGQDGPREGADASVSVDDAALTAGGMLRAARERQGVHIAVLAAAIKVSPRKLDALEGDRFQELPDATFTRALAQTVCRALKIDAQPVLAKLPSSGPAPLDQVSSGLNTPFRERPGRMDAATALPRRPLIWAGVALLVAAGALLVLPVQDWNWSLASLSAGPAPAAATTPAAATATAPAGATAASAVAPAVADAAAPTASGVAVASLPASAPPTAPVIETVHSAPPAEAAVAARGATLTTTDPSWIEVIDGGGQTVFSRVVQPGEAVNLDGALPLRMKIGNARATQLVFRGQPVDLETFTRDNVARVELK
jgi:cytoskeleton protein RodZ